MKALNKSATAILNKIIAKIPTGEDYTSFDNSGKTFMPVNIECIGKQGDRKLWALSHTFIQNGDLMRDPEVIFVEMTDRKMNKKTWEIEERETFAPISFKQDPYFEKTHVEFEDGKPVRWNKHLQYDNANFCNGWLKNIKYQQGLK